MMFSEQRLMGRLLTYMAAGAVLLIVAFPLYGLLLTSVQPEKVIRSRHLRLFPTDIDPSHYEAVFAGGRLSIMEGMFNTAVVALSSACLVILIAIPATYGLTRLALPGRRLVLGTLVSVYTFPTLLFLLPLYGISVRAQLYDSRLGLVLLYSAFALPFVIWILRGFLLAIPLEVEDAARVDGASLVQMLLRIVIPLMAPGIFACALLSFVFAWVEFLSPLVLTSRTPILTVTLGLFRSHHEVLIGQLAASAVVTAFPVVLITAVFQRRIAEALLAGSER